MNGCIKLQMHVFEIFQMHAQVFEIIEIQIFSNFSNADANANVFKLFKCKYENSNAKASVLKNKIKCVWFVWHQSLSRPLQQQQQQPNKNNNSNTFIYMLSYKVNICSLV